MNTSELAPEKAEEIEADEVLDAQPEPEANKDQPEAKGEMPEQTETDPVADELTGEEQEEEIVGIEIEGESPTQEDEKEETPDWVKNTRKENREHIKANKKLQKRIDELEGKNQPTETKLRPKPTLEGHNEDEEAYAADLEKWLGEKGEVNAKIQKAADAQKEIDNEVNGRLSKYQERKSTIGKSIADYDMLVSEAEDNLNDLQRNSIAYYFKESAAEIMYYLGKKPDELKKLTSITDTTEMLLAVKDIQSKVKVSTRKPSTKPETVPVGNVRHADHDSELSKLEKQARKDGNRAPVIAYKLKKARSG